MIADTEKRWAIYCNGKDFDFLCGKYFFDGCYLNQINDSQVKTFRTRKLARKAKKDALLGKEYKVVPVIAKVEMI